MTHQRCVWCDDASTVCVVFTVYTQSDTHENFCFCLFVKMVFFLCVGLYSRPPRLDRGHKITFATRYGVTRTSAIHAYAHTCTHTHTHASLSLARLRALSLSLSLSLSHTHTTLSAPAEHKSEPSGMKQQQVTSLDPPRLTPD